MIAIFGPGTHPDSVYGLSNFMGPLTENLVRHAGYVTCTNEMQVAGHGLCMQVHRMPLPPLLLAGLVEMFGAQYRAVDLAKISLVLIPVAVSFGLVWERLRFLPESSLRWQIPAFLLCCLLLPTLMVNVIHLQVEEGYSFCLLAYAFAVVLFVGEQGQYLPTRHGWAHAALFAMAVLGLYLTKSSMIIVCIFLVGMYCRSVRQRWLVLLVICISVSGPLGWAMYSLHSTGRFTLGTSLDGINLHKGNNETFLKHYPPLDGGSLDRYDISLNNGKFFIDEWTFNEYHIHAALEFMESHPLEDVRGDLRKADMFFFSMRKVGSEKYTGILGLATMTSMVLFRLLLWGACLLAFYLGWRGSAEQRNSALIFGGVVLTVAAPYMVGFAFTRHASVLILPSALYVAYGCVTTWEGHAKDSLLVPAASQDPIR